MPVTMYYATDRCFHSYFDIIQHGKSFTFLYLCFRQMSIVTAWDRADELWQNIVAWPTYTFVSYSNGSTSTFEFARILRRVEHGRKYRKTKHLIYNLLRATCKEYNRFNSETSTAADNNSPKQIQFKFLLSAIALSHIIYCERKIWSSRGNTEKNWFRSD